jgi:midasin
MEEDARRQQAKDEVQDMDTSQPQVSGGRPPPLLDDAEEEPAEEEGVDDHAQLRVLAEQKRREEAAERMRAAIEVLQLRTGMSEAERGRELWRRYDALTADLSAQLCEQLRLILQPSLATKLKGDYRSGKRINMKKIIPYIASQFKKDKIWLRRTKPHRRSYQVLLAIDDSRSMSTNHSGPMACEAVALIANALTKLEVGEVAIAKFGEFPQLLHAFDAPFNEEAGARVMSQFTFRQQKDDFTNLLVAALQILSDAKQNQRVPAEQLQLFFVISDGWLVLQQHAALNAAIRQAQERGVLLVFLIIDGPSNKDSILQTQSISFGPDNRVRTSNYLDRFPFPYYVLLRRIHQLPEVLADALRQWFELTQQQQQQRS